MPRVARVDIANYPYHVINRAVMRLPIFHNDSDYKKFENVLEDAVNETGIKVFAYAVMPNHWHFLLSPPEDGLLGTFMHQLTSTHSRRVKTATNTIGAGPLYQGRYKSFLIQEDEHFLTVLKYIEQNPLRANLVSKAEDWQWGSAWRRVYGTAKQQKLLAPPPVPLPKGYRTWINQMETKKELEAVRTSVNKGTPFGSEGWVEKVVDKFDLGSTLRTPGRPKKK